MSSTATVLSRDCEATQVPYGDVKVLPAGTRVRVMQSLGDSFTVATEQGEMMRVDGKNADALGRAIPQAPAAGSPVEFSEKLVWDQLKTVFDPEIPVNVVDLGLIYACQITPVDGPSGAGHKIDIKMSMTAPGCGMGDVLRADIERKLSGLPAVKEVHAEIVFEPPWNPGRMSEAAKLQLGLDLDSGPSLPLYPR
jgi:probable FeS assembly SUF system protein SufT